MNQDHEKAIEQPSQISRRVILVEKLHPLVELSQNEYFYSLRIKLPGVPSNYRELKLAVEQDGDLILKGLVTDSEIWKQLIREFEYLLDELATNGRFSLSMYVLGPVDIKLTELSFEPNGNLVLFFRKHETNTNRSKWAHL